MKIAEILSENKKYKLLLSDPKIKNLVYNIIDQIAEMDSYDILDDIGVNDIVNVLKENYSNVWIEIFERISYDLGVKMDEKKIKKYFSMPNQKFRNEISKVQPQFYDFFIQKLEDTRAWEKIVDYDFMMPIEQEINWAKDSPEEFINNGGLQSSFFGEKFEWLSRLPPPKKQKEKKSKISLSKSNIKRSTRSADLQKRDNQDSGNLDDISYDVNYDEEPDRLFDPFGTKNNDDIPDPNVETEDDIIDRLDRIKSLTKTNK